MKRRCKVCVGGGGQAEGYEEALYGVRGGGRVRYTSVLVWHACTCMVGEGELQCVWEVPDPSLAVHTWSTSYALLPFLVCCLPELHYVGAPQGVPQGFSPI